MDYSDCSSCLNETIISFSGILLMRSRHVQTDHWRAEEECLCSAGSSLVFPVEGNDDEDDDEYLTLQQHNHVWFF